MTENSSRLLWRNPAFTQKEKEMPYGVSFSQGKETFMKKTFWIIDGSSMLTTAYYATIPKQLLYAKEEKDYSQLMHTHDGLYTNAVVAMLRTVLNLIRDYQPAYLAFAFDRSRNTFRRKLYPEYKSTRSETPEPLKEQYGTMTHILQILGFQVYGSEDYEADDYAGSLAEHFWQEADEVIAYTKDMDYLQLVDDSKGISVWMPGKGRNPVPKSYQKKQIVEEYGLRNGKQVIDYKALAGDSSDHIPGVKGIGEKAAVPLLAHYPTIEDLYAAMEEKGPGIEEEWKAWGLRKGTYRKLEQDRENAYLSKKLATIRTDLQIMQPLEAHCCRIDPEDLRAVIRSYGFQSLQSYL